MVSTPPRRLPELTRSGIILSGQEVPLYAGSVHYWQLEPQDWRPCLQALVGMGLRLVDTYIPWGVHEVGPGRLDLGETNPRLDVVRFLRLAEELGLWAIVRPGPHINAELTYFGLPERVVWDPACQARGPSGHPVLLPMVPHMFPVPSYASQAYLDEVRRYFHVLGAALSPLRYPDGPIVLLQIDNEGALFFRDGAYDQDYHPDALVQYRAFLRERYGTITSLCDAYGDHVRVDPTRDEEGAEAPGLRFSNLLPPRRFAASDAGQLAYYLDWAAFQEQLLVGALTRFRADLEAAGLGGVPTSHNFPMAQDTTPLNAARVGQVVDLIGYDYYHRASEGDRATVARRTSALAARCDSLDRPAFACEMGAGFPPYFPPLSELDSEFTILAALAYGLRGFNVYMAVERDRWIGAPVDRRGRARPFAERWRKLCAALDEVGFHRLRRQVPVRLVVPRIERRLARVMHAFGPATGALFSVMGQGARESCFEDDLGLGYPLAIEADTFVRSFEQALDARGVPYAHASGEDRDILVKGASWIVCATSGGFADSLAVELAAAAASGTRVTLGPRPRRFDGAMRPLRALDPLAGVELLERTDPASADAAVSRAVEGLRLPRYASDPDPIQVTVHHDEDGEMRVAFVINPTSSDLVARVTLGVDGSWRDLLEGDCTQSKDGLLELRVKPHTVRFLARG